MINAPLKDSLSYSTIEKLNAFRQSKLPKVEPFKTFCILFKNFKATDLHRDTQNARLQVYGKTFANEILDIRNMSKRQLHTYLKNLRYINGYQNSYIKSTLSKQDKIDLANKRKLYSYASTRLKLTKN